MTGFVLRIAIVALGLWLATKIFDGLNFDSPGTLLAAALLLGLVNAVIRPIAVILTLPLTLVTLGLFLLVINAAMLSLVAWMLDGMTVGGFWSAFFGAIVVSIVGWLVTWFIGGHGRVEQIEMERV
jgi:putative membrane protein